MRRTALLPLHPESDEPAAFQVERRTPNGSARPIAGAEKVLAAAGLSGECALWVEDHAGRGELRVEDGASSRTLDTDVLPELAVSPDESRALYVRRTPDGAELVLLEASSWHRSVVYAGPTADRPIFREDGRAFAFVGTGDGGFASLFVIEGGSPARQLTNIGLRTGHGLPPGFVPPPRDTSGMTFTEQAIRYATPTGTCIVDLRAGTAECAGEGR